MLFHFAIPQQHPRIAFQRIECIRTNTKNEERNNCHRLKNNNGKPSLYDSHGWQSLEKRIDQIQELIHEIPLNRRQRVTRGWGSEILASITDLSTQTAVNRIVTILRRVELGVNHASETWQVSTSSFISSTKVLNTRVNNLFHLMSDETRSVNTLYTTMRNFYINANNTLNHLSHSIVQISRIML